MPGSNNAAERDNDFAIIWRNLKGPKDKDLLATAEALDRRRRDPNDAMTLTSLAAKSNVSREIVREFLSLLKLPPSVQARFRSGELRTLEQGRRLYQLHLRRPELVEEAAQAMTSLDAHRSRALADYLIRNPGSDVPTAAKATEEDRTQVTREVHIVAQLEPSDYAALRREAHALGTNEVQLVTDIVKAWLSDHQNLDV